MALPEEIVILVDHDLKGKLGEGRSDVLRTIIMNWLGEKGISQHKRRAVKKMAKSRMPEVKRETEEEIDLLNSIY